GDEERGEDHPREAGGEGEEEVPRLPDGRGGVDARPTGAVPRHVRGGRLRRVEQAGKGAGPDERAGRAVHAVRHAAGRPEGQDRPAQAGQD
ncbi:hypothetical protein ABI046_14915, partial [Enterococcus faecium]